MYDPRPGDAKPPVFKPMEMSTAETLLREAKEILDGFGIVFFLRHGTCLGAIREQALIEWDDDLDIGSIIGLHGLTEDAIDPAVDAFRERDFNAIVTDTDFHIGVELSKLGTPMGWTCYRIIDDNIYQWPGVKIPVSLHTNLKQIDFLGEQFNVPNPPEEYLRLKYGPEWMIPKRTGFEQDILNLIPDEESSGGLGKVMQAMEEASAATEYWKPESSRFRQPAGRGSRSHPGFYDTGAVYYGPGRPYETRSARGRLLRCRGPVRRS